jgi:hypothetical protein
MDPNNIANILAHLSNNLYITQEVIFGAGEAVQPNMYLQNGEKDLSLAILTNLFITQTRRRCHGVSS